MPLEIRELVIKTSIDEGGAAKEGAPGTGRDNPDREELIADCVEQVMQVLRDAAER